MKHIQSEILDDIQAVIAQVQEAEGQSRNEEELDRMEAGWALVQLVRQRIQVGSRVKNAHHDLAVHQLALKYLNQFLDYPNKARDTMKQQIESRFSRKGK